jgi:hypothetical protein
MVHTALKCGDRFRLSELGRQRNPRVRSQFGTVISIGSRATTDDVVKVILDGNASPTQMHRSYIKPLHEIGESEPS